MRRFGALHWRRLVLWVGLLLIAACMTLIGFLLRGADRLQVAANVAQLVSVILAVPSVVAMVWQWRNKGFAGELGDQRKTLNGRPMGRLKVAREPTVFRAADGRTEIFVRGTGNHLWHLWQTTPNGDWSDWEDLSRHRPLPSGLLTVKGDPAANSAADGRIEIFVPDTHGHLWCLRQTVPNGDWREWEDLGGYRPFSS